VSFVIPFTTVGNLKVHR